MSFEKYIGGAFAANDSDAFKLTSPSDSAWFLPENDKSISGFETGADAIAWILKHVDEKTVYFPLHYCQETINRIALKAQENQILRYSHFSEIPSDPSVVIWNHFNGYHPVPADLLSSNHFIIEDCVQSLSAMKHMVGHAAVTSLRKWLELDLAVVVSPFEQTEITSPSDYHALKKDAERLKHKWKNDPESVEESAFLKKFATAEKLLENETIYSADLSELYHYDWQKIIERRAENARVLIQGSNPQWWISLIQQHELFVMISLENRDEFRKTLAENGIFAPIHWLDSADETKAKSLLSLPIDQRYNADDMKRIIRAIEHGLAASDLQSGNH